MDCNAAEREFAMPEREMWKYFLRFVLHTCYILELSQDMRLARGEN